MESNWYLLALNWIWWWTPISLNHLTTKCTVYTVFKYKIWYSYHKAVVHPLIINHVGLFRQHYSWYGNTTLEGSSCLMLEKYQVLRHFLLNHIMISSSHDGFNHVNYYWMLLFSYHKFASQEKSNKGYTHFTNVVLYYYGTYCWSSCDNTHHYSRPLLITHLCYWFYIPYY